MKKLIRKIVDKVTGQTIVDACDEYLNWLFVSNAGMQEKGNVFCFETAIRNLPNDAPVIEIGAHAGLSANIMRYLLHKYKKTNDIISVDPWLVRGYDDEKEGVSRSYLEVLGNNPDIDRKSYARFIQESYIRNVRFFSAQKLPFAFEADSDSFFDWWKNQRKRKDIMGQEYQLGGPISFAFIDGNHDEDYARRDFENCDRWLVKGGYILFDNSEDGSPFGSAIVAKKLVNDSRYKLVLKNPNRLFRKV